MMKKLGIRTRMTRFLAVGICFSLTSCAVPVQNIDLMTNMKPENIVIENEKDLSMETAEFSMELFKKTASEKENTLISPLSVLLALAMTANGSNHETTLEMEKVLAGGNSIKELNEYLYTYVSQLPSQKGSQLKIANSIWFRKDELLQLKEEFLQTNATYYQAAAYQSPFDNTTIKDMNQWVQKNTNGMIDQIIDHIKDDTMLFLLNAVAFDAKWKSPYYKNDVYEGIFTTEKGEKRNVPMMYSVESKYLEDTNTIGFVKNYQEDAYSFVGLLPKEGMSIEEYLENLTADSFQQLLTNAQNTNVTVRLPKFEFDYTISMNDALKELGLKTAFDSEEADFSNMSDTMRLFIGNVIHKSYISVDELGTKAGAVTKVEMEAGSAQLGYTVTLERPFVFAIIDNKTNLPIFLGTVLDIN